MATTQKAIDLVGELRNALQRYFSVVSDVQFDTDGNPFITCTQGTLASGQQAGLVKISPVPSIQVDSLGLSQKVYATHLLQIVLESTSSTITGAGVAVLDVANLVPFLGEDLGRECRNQLYLVANGTGVSTAGITGSPAATWDGVSLKYRLMINQ